jgi:prepilin peptidase CpaA
MLYDANLLSGSLLAMLAILVSYAAWTDVRQRRIPNWVSAVTLATGLAAIFAVGGPEQMGWSTAHSAVALVVGMILTAFRWIGAGDAKFYAAIAAWLPIQLGLWLVVSVALAGFLLLVGFAMKRRGRIARTSDEHSDFDKLPYGIAIGFGGLLAVALA